MEAPDGDRDADDNWMDSLNGCPLVTLIEVTGDAAQIEYGGVAGKVWYARAGLCVALKLAIAEPPREWVAEITLALGAIGAACDDALTCDDGDWYLWRRHDLRPGAPALRERLDAQAALAGRLAETAMPVGTTDGSDLGRLI